jgi:glutaredoxin
MPWIRFDGKINKFKVIMYSLSYCHACERAKNYLKQRNVAFSYLDVDKADADERQEAAGVFGMELPEGGVTIAFPIILVDGEALIMGFDREKISKALNLEDEEEKLAQ